jgi:hypothetical protein
MSSTKKNNQTVRFDYSRFIVLFSIHPYARSHKEKTKRCFLFIPFSLCSLHCRDRSLPYSLGFVYSFAICSSLKLFTCLDASLCEDFYMLGVKSTGGGMYCDLYRSGNCSSGGGVFYSLGFICF